MAVAAELISGNTYVESPFIIVDIGGVTFGDSTSGSNAKYPNYMKSVTVTKTNGMLNVYRIELLYGVTENDDPNFIDKALSGVADSRKLKIQYGDWNSPGYIYKDEDVLITKVTTNVSFSQSQLSYIIEGTSTATSLTATVYNFPARTKTKGSDILKELIANKAYGVSDVFTGMTSMDTVINNNMIASDDAPVDIPAKTQTSIIDYISSVTDYMTSNADTNTDIKSSVYTWSPQDDPNNEVGGPYFTVQKMSADEAEVTATSTTYEVTVGYPNTPLVTEFSIRDDNSWAILYSSSSNANMGLDYSVDDSGAVVSSKSPAIMSGKYGAATSADKTWWTNMTQFPISATLKIKGILRPTVLMSYVKVNVYFYGNSHVSSGTYYITKQQDEVSASGFRTTLEMTRLSSAT